MREGRVWVVLLSQLKNDPEQRTIRAVIPTKNEQIIVYEPTKQDVSDILDLKDMLAEFNNGMATGELEVSGQTIMRELIPMLTNMEIDEGMSDEEMQNIIDNPSLPLLQVTHILKGIITEILTILIIATTNDTKSESLADYVDDMQEALADTTVNRLAKDDKNKETVMQIIKHGEELKEAQKEEFVKQAVSDLEVANELDEDAAMERITNVDEDEEQQAVQTDTKDTDLSYQERIKALAMGNYNFDKEK